MTLIICPSCGGENRPERKFCLQCGGRLEPPCPACGTPNEAGARFCGECGGVLGADAPVPPTPVAAAAPSAERRLVTVLFTDLVGFTNLAEDRDPEAVRELLSRYFDAATETVQLHGGTVEKFIGDAVMAVWGTPTAHEDDAERAVRAALELIDAVKALHPGLQARGGQRRADVLEPPFVGRDEELRQLKDVLHAVGRERRPRLVSITGPGGIGKSRLVWELEKYIDGVREDIWWHRGRSPSYGEGVTFWALGEMVRRRARLTEDDDETATRERIAATLEEYAPDAGDRERIGPALLTLLGVEEAPAGGRDALFPAWRLFFERIAERGTTVLVFEDLQWADTASTAASDPSCGPRVTAGVPGPISRRPTSPPTGSPTSSSTTVCSSASAAATRSTSTPRRRRSTSRTDRRWRAAPCAGRRSENRGPLVRAPGRRARRHPWPCATRPHRRWSGGYGASLSAWSSRRASASVSAAPLRRSRVRPRSSRRTSPRTALSRAISGWPTRRWDRTAARVVTTTVRMAS